MNIDTPLNQQTSAAVWNWKAGVAGWRRDEVVVEEPLEIRVNGHAVSVTMRTPGFDEELAAGFLLAERVVTAPRDTTSILRGCSGSAGANVINVSLASDVRVDLQHLTRHVFAGSSCGLCGTVAIDRIAKDFPPVRSDVRFPAALLAALPDQMAETQLTFHQTGGLHAAALFDEDGRAARPSRRRRAAQRGR